MKRYYLAVNVQGFDNTWDVLVFETVSDRSDYKDECDCRGILYRCIPLKLVTKYASNFNMNRNEYIKPRPFSGEYWGLREHYSNWGDNVRIVDVCSPYDNCERLYK